MKQSILIVAICLFSCALFAQKTPLKWGKVPAKDLAMTVYEADPDANAVVLADFGSIVFGSSPTGLNYRFNRHKRIKILKQAGYEEGDITIHFRDEGESFGRLKVSVYAPDGSEISLSKKDIFEEQISKSWKAKKFSVPNLQEGSVIEYKYEITSENLFSLRDWYFQDVIPTRWSELRVEMPDILEYVNLFQGMERLTINEKENSTLMLSDGMVDTEKRRYVAENVPALKEEAYITNVSDYLARIKFQLAKLDIPGRLVETYLTSWEEVAEDLWKDEDLGKQINKSNQSKDLMAAVAPSIAAAKTDMDKVKAVYQFLLNNMEWNEYYGIYASDKLDDSFEKKTGNGATLNLMLIALLREQGIAANPLLISTRSNGKMIDVYPIVGQFNHLLAHIEVDGEMLVADVTNEFRPVGLPRINALNNKGLLIKDGKPQWIGVVAQPGSDIIMSTLALDENGTLTGEVVCNHRGYSAVSERENYADDKEGKYWKERFTERFPEANLTSIKFEEAENINEDFKETMQIDVPEAGQASGDFIYVSPLVYANFDENPFKLEKRDYPVDIPYPIHEQLISKISIPAGYTAAELPESIKLVLPNNAAKFQYMVSQKENEVQIISRLKIDQLVYQPEEYEAIKNFFDLLVEKQGEQIVLKKTL